jgi:hypothetical protein
VKTSPLLQRSRITGPRVEGLLWKTYTAWAGHKYLTLATSLFVICVIPLAKQRWIEGADIWEHAAVIRAFVDAPLQPHHPELLVNAPHTFFSPYLFALGLTARISGANPFTVLAWAGILNLALVLIAFRLFVGLFSVRRDAPFYAMIFTLLLWGRDVWGYSGFLHLDLLWQVLPYPATFAKIPALIGVVAFDRFLKKGSYWPLLAMLPLGAIVVLSHPIDLVFMYLGCLTLFVGSSGSKSILNLGILAVLAILTVFIALVWPFFPFGELVLGEKTYRTLIAQDERPLFVGVISRLLPTILTVPVIFLRFFRKRTDPLALMFLVLLAVYLIGGLTEHWFVGRLIVFLTMVLHVALGVEVAELGTLPWTGWPGRFRMTAGLTVTSLCVWGRSHLARGIAPALPDRMAEKWFPGSLNGYLDTDRLSSMLRNVGPDDVVLAQPLTGWQVPAFTGRIVSTLHPLAFVPDLLQRRADASRFFDPATAKQAHEEILRKYCVSFVLLDFSTQHGFAPPGVVRYSDDRFVLTEVRDNDRSCRRPAWLRP